MAKARRLPVLCCVSSALATGCTTAGSLAPTDASRDTSVESSPVGPDHGSLDAAPPQSDSGPLDSGPLDSGPLEDARPNNAIVDASPFCTVPLSSDAGPSTLDDLPLSTWCRQLPGAVYEWSTPCGGYIAVGLAVGVDCDRHYVFDVASRRLVAITSGCNGHEQCVAGDPAFMPPMDPDGGFYDTNCLSGRVSFDLCAEAGIPPLPDGAGFQCELDSQCPAGYRCVYGGISLGPCTQSPACGVTLGICYSPFDLEGQYPNCTPICMIACDGTTAQGCADSQGNGYFFKRVAIPNGTTCGGSSPQIPLDAGLLCSDAD